MGRAMVVVSTCTELISPADTLSPQYVKIWLWISLSSLAAVFHTSGFFCCHLSPHFCNYRVG